MIWATRRHVHIDRTACAWLIQRFVDSDAEFVFVDDPDEVPAEATPFDMRAVELGHRDGRCSFESVLVRYQLDDPALERIGQLVHEADIGDERYDAPEAAGIDTLLRGLALSARDDQAMIDQTAPLYDALYDLWSHS
ncbi:MAG TPA: chromate resistance protein ChrB domain-containing protein [Thermomicrobiales bacterium]|nr:chromate resistance protein ChrB domain-containing protein [Thermomicrobiales bacterium]